MKKQISVLKLTFLAAATAALTVGCSTSGSARADLGDHEMGVGGAANVDSGAGVSASADLDTDADVDIDNDNRIMNNDSANYTHNAQQGNQNESLPAAGTGSSRITVSPLSFAPETRTYMMSVWPREWNVRVIESYTFRVPDAGADLQTSNDGTTFRSDLAPGAVFVEAAGSEGSSQTYRVIQHSPNPR